MGKEEHKPMTTFSVRGYKQCSVKVEGFEFRDNNATTHITEENGVASINFLVGLVV